MSGRVGKYVLAELGGECRKAFADLFEPVLGSWLESSPRASERDETAFEHAGLLGAQTEIGAGRMTLADLRKQRLVRVNGVPMRGEPWRNFTLCAKQGVAGMGPGK